MELWELSAAEMRRRLDSREISAAALTRAHLARIRDVDPEVNAFITVSEDRALRDADTAQKRIDEGSVSALTGIPVALKDNMATLGIKTTCASKMLENYVPPYSGTLERKLSGTGAVLLGKTNMDEFAMGTSTEFSAFFPTRNPYDLERVPGGSSGGSAAAVAARMTPIAFGSDTGGSVRQPASLCGVVGFKPTYGRVSRYGLVAFSSSLDQIGPFARTVLDAMDAFEASMGPDGLDSTCMEAPYDAAAARGPSMKGRRLGVPKELLSVEIDAAVRERVSHALDKFTAEGAEVDEFSASMIEHGVSTYYIIAPAEASSNLARFDGVRYGLRVPDGSHIDMMRATRAQGFGREVKERIIIGTHVLSSGYYEAYYAKAHQVRTLMKRQFQEAFQKFDAVVCPTSPTTAFKIGALTGDPMMLKLLDYCTIPANIGGFPAISLNCGYFKGLPIGIQFVCDSFEEEKLFSISLAAEALLASPGAPLAV
ncbi:MAG: Asp-tRNA(Asn)/Glu-tRNA(Gln) amidotransferase subunit GatA [Fimbriimonadales bacterium]